MNKIRLIIKANAPMFIANTNRVHVVASLVTSEKQLCVLQFSAHKALHVMVNDKYDNKK